MREKNVPRPLDSVQGKLIAYGIVAVFLGLITFLGVKSVSGPQLHPGDRLESMTCRYCQGGGQNPEGDKKCRACLGTRKLKVVVPGPEHPVEIRGTVRDLSAFSDAESARQLAESDSEPRNLTPVKGAVRGARIRLQGSGKTVELESKATGRFRAALKPGEYQVEVSAAGLKPWQQSLSLKPRTEPIWPKVAGLADSPEESQIVHFYLSP